ncbi:MAG TPA: PEP-CTERM sorting domain-containing protein [Candidatus Acidoferrum sp.]|nr:PEP-CTERM sorting domain-containing protein [Candidatus Acidoferrum sp.]
MKSATLMGIFRKPSGHVRTAASVLLVAVAPAAFAQTQYSVTSLGSLGGASAFGWGINNNGQVTGWSATGGSGAHAFLYSGGAMTDLGTLGGADSYAGGMNNNGQVVGASEYNGSINRHAFLYSGGTMTDLGTFGGAVSFANAINDSGQVVGVATASDGTGYAFLYRDGTMSNLGSFTPHAINNSGQIVGEAYNNGTDTYHAFIYENGQMLDLNNLIPAGSGLTLTDAEGINDQGQIVANGNYGGQNQAFLLSPIPEPATGALLAAFLAGWALCRRRLGA